MNVLISLHRGYGLGDAVQMSAVLRHVAKHRPGWVVDFQAEEGRHVVGRGIAASTFAYGQPYPTPRYDAEVQIVLYDTWAGWVDRPNTRVSSCLHERFGIPWDPECGRYQVNVPPEVLNKVRIGSSVVAVHTVGNTAKDKKDLTHEQTAGVLAAVHRLGRLPLLLGNHNPWGSDAAYNCAVISQCEAFVGIDSGPGKCASATDTPSLIVWTGHHPAAYHDPAPNTTHLVPAGYNSVHPVRDDPGVVRWFSANYRVLEYVDDPVERVAAWLKEVLK